jgi:putative transposase
MMPLIEKFAALLGLVAVCEALGLSRATWYRFRAAQATAGDRPPPAPAGADADPPRPTPRKLTTAEEQRVLDVLHEPRFADQAPAEVYATLLDEGTYLCSIRTMYRVLHKHQEVRERRALCVHPAYAKPELLATRPNQLWSWDITKLRGPSTWTYYYLYVILDVFSRYVVGWMLALRESEDLARELIATSCERHNILPGELTLHADRGSAMTAKTVAQLLVDLDVAKTHSRPHVSDDNPYSEAQFKTLKYRPDFPDRFGSEQDARAFCVPFFDWYNTEHHHSGLALLTPADVHFGHGAARLTARDATLAAAHAAHPERFVGGTPHAPRPPTAAWINPPKTSSAGPHDGPPSCAPKELGGLGGPAPDPRRDLQ